MRVHELAKELGQSSSNLLSELQALGFGVTSPSSGLSEEEADQVRAAYAAVPPDGGAASASTAPPAAPPEEAAGAAASPQRAKKKAGAKTTGKAAASAAPSAGASYVLVRKGSVSTGVIVVRKGEAIDEQTLARLPERVHKYFDCV